MPLLLKPISREDLPRQLPLKARIYNVSKHYKLRRREESQFYVTNMPQQNLSPVLRVLNRSTRSSLSQLNYCNARQPPLTGLGLLNQPCFNILYDSILSLTEHVEKTAQILLP